MYNPDHARKMRDSINGNPVELARRRQLMLDANPMTKPGVKEKWYQSMLDGARFVQIAEGQALPIGTIRDWDCPYLFIKTEFGWQYHHRWVMEQYLGRELAADEHVHHVDENKKNNSIDNLVILSPSEHSRLHNGSYHVE